MSKSQEFTIVPESRFNLGSRNKPTRHLEAITGRVPEYIPHGERKRYAKLGSALYYLKQMHQEFGLPNPHKDAKHYQEKEDAKKKKRKKKSDSDDEKKAKKKKGPQDDNYLQVKAIPKDPKDEPPKTPFGDYCGEHPFRMIISGTTGSGKSTLLVHLLNNVYTKYFTHIYVMAKTLHEDPVWKGVQGIPKDNYMEDYDPQFVHQLREKQKNFIKEHGIRAADTILLVMDDFAADKHAIHDKEIQGLNSYGRKDSISICTLTQKYNRVLKFNRCQTELIIVFPTGNNSEFEALMHEQRSVYFPAGRPGNDCFDRVYRECTAPDEIDEYPFMVINHQAEYPEIYRKRLYGVLKLKIDPETHMVDMTPVMHRISKQRAQTSLLTKQYKEHGEQTSSDGIMGRNDANPAGAPGKRTRIPPP